MKNLGLLFVLTGLVSCASHSVNQDHLEMATLWTQKSGEAKAISYQAFNLAKRLIDESLRRPSKSLVQLSSMLMKQLLINYPFRQWGY